MGATLALAVAVGAPLAAVQPVPVAPPSGEDPTAVKHLALSHDPPAQEALAPEADERQEPPAIVTSDSREALEPSDEVLGEETSLAPRNTIDARTQPEQPQPNATDAAHRRLDAEIQAEILAEMGTEVDATRFATLYAARYAERYPARYIDIVRQSARSGGTRSNGEARRLPTETLPSRPFPNPDT